MSIRLFLPGIAYPEKSFRLPEECLPFLLVTRGKTIPEHHGLIEPQVISPKELQNGIQPAVLLCVITGLINLKFYPGKPDLSGYVEPIGEGSLSDGKIIQ
jgi:hypothetical protein